MAGTKRGFGNVRKLPSGRYQARYDGPDLATHKAPSTFTSKADAEAWLAAERRLIEREEWRAPGPRKAAAEATLKAAAAPLTFGEYAEGWLERRPLAPRTQEHYRKLLDVHILPKFRTTPIREIRPRDVAAWQHVVSTRTGATMTAHAYSLLRAICSTAFAEEEIIANPCRVRGAGNTARKVKIQPATVAELAAIADAMPERLTLAVLLAGWCALRFGEIFELRRDDVALVYTRPAAAAEPVLTGGSVTVSRGVVRVKGATIVKTPKTSSSVRTVAMPPHVLPAALAHLDHHTGPAADALLFPGRSGSHLAYASLMAHYYPARDSAGRPDLRWHDLRHTGATLASAAGGTLSDVMARLGHSTVGAAMRYAHAAKGADALLAERLSGLALASGVDN